MLLSPFLKVLKLRLTQEAGIQPQALNVYSILNCLRVPAFSVVTNGRLVLRRICWLHSRLLNNGNGGEAWGCAHTAPLSLLLKPPKIVGTKVQKETLVRLWGQLLIPQLYLT